MSTKLQAVLFLVGLATGNAWGQDVPRFSKVELGAGMKAYFPSKPEVERTLSADSSHVYTCEVAWKEFFFSTIAVKFSQSLTDEDLELLAESYLDFLKGQFGVTGSAGYGRGHTLESNPKAKGIIDYWEDGDKNQYSVKAWVDPNCMGVMILYGPKEFPNFNVAQLFLNGFRFPE
jgi:hypothetical protein